jgi:exosortase
MIANQLSRRHYCFAALVLLTLGFAWRSVQILGSLALRYDYYNHILVVPLISLICVYWLDRKQIFSRVQEWLLLGLLPMAVALVFLLLLRFRSTQMGDRVLALSICALIVAWLSAFLFVYGTDACRRATFPMLFLFLMVPVPHSVIDKAVVGLQEGSSGAVDALFRLFGVPVFREGFVFQLPGISIRVAEECSGIHSSIALLIVCLLAGHIFLRIPWCKIFFVACVVPIAIVKNAIRIFILSVLTLYVNPHTLDSSLHHQGGVVFFLPALAAVFALLNLLVRVEEGRMPDRGTGVVRSRGLLTTSVENGTLS